MRTYKYALCAAALAAACSPALALQGSPNKPKSQTPAAYVASMLKPAKTEAPVDFGAFTLSGKAAWSIKAGLYFGLWYFFNIFYNVANKKALNALELPWLQSLACVAVGMPYILLMWAVGARPVPNISKEMIAGSKGLAMQSFLHAAGNVGGNVAFFSGALGFAHVLKSCEPAFTAIFSGLITGSWDHPYVYATLIPIMGGVAYASASELNFNMLQFVAAMVSNIAFSLRAILGKLFMDNAKVRATSKLDGPNTFATMQAGATLFTIPAVVAFEGASALWPPAHPNWKKSIGKFDHAGTIITESYLWKNLLLAGLMFQLYYECAFLALDAVSPVTHSIGNNLKRIVIVITSVIIFNQKMSTQSMVGSAVAVGGVLLYGQVKEAYKNTAKKASK